MGNNPKQHSFSRLDQFTRCERFSGFHAILGEDVTPAQKRAFAFGKKIHDMLENVCNRVRKGGELDEAMEVIKKGQESQFKDYLEKFRPVLEKTAPKHVEHWFRSADGLPVVGKVDLVSNTTPLFTARALDGVIAEPCVIDWKTSRNPTSVMEMLANMKRSMQLRIYCLAMGIDRAAYVVLLTTGYIYGESVKFTENDLALARRWLSGTINAVDNRWAQALNKDGSYDLSTFALASPTDRWCSSRYCGFWDRCLGAENGCEVKVDPPKKKD